MHHPFKVLSLSHTHAPVEIRELLYLPEDHCKQLLGRLGDVLGLQEVLILSTCNRTEFYYVSEEDLSRELISLLFITKGLTQADEYRPYFRHITDYNEALRYLFEVSMGLHSSVLGDIQISNQVKQAYSWSHEAQMANAFLHRLMHTIFHTNKRVHQETAYRDGAASVSYAAAELAEELVGHLNNPSVLVVGLGEMGRDVASSLDPASFDAVYLCNRTNEKAEQLAIDLQSKYLPFERLAEFIPHADVVISAVTVKEPLIQSDWVESTRIRPQYFLDLSVPRSIAHEVEDYTHVVSFTVDDLHTRTHAALEKRKSAIPQVKQVIAEEIRDFISWTQELQLSPTIHKIKAALEQIRKEEMARFIKNATEQEVTLLDEVTKGMVHKILRMPVLRLKDACKRGEQEELIDFLNDLFDLEADREKKSGTK